MRAVRSKDTSAELIVRRILYASGYRYRLHVRELPGCPDIVFPGRKKAIFVHGCFWHGHDCARGARKPKANADYWQSKIEKNKARDGKTAAAFEAAGWRAEIIWECELRDKQSVRSRLIEFVGSKRAKGDVL